ncbi:MAG: hypothetical protein KDK70_34810, partial [Myxococcales bacterium]|nr:hypothetical protein [Myxococcales bacterium]
LGWAAMTQQSCEATRVRGVQSDELYELRTACLARWRSTFEYTTGRLAQLVPGQAEAARALVEQQPPVATCEAEALRSSIALRGMAASRTDRSRSPEASAAHDRIQGLLDHTRGERLLGTHARALALARQAEHEARRMGLRYLEAEAIQLRVALEFDAGGSPRAQAELRRALSLAVEADDPDTAALVVVRLLSLERLGAEPVADRVLLAALGRSWAARTPRPAVLHAQIEFEEAHHAQERGDHEAALVRIGEARAALRKAGRAHDTIALELRIIEGRSLLDLGRFESAERELDELVSLMERRLPEGHIHLGDAAFYLASARLERGKAEAALPWARRAWTIYRDRLGPHDDKALFARQLLARCWWRRGDPGRAAAELEALVETITGAYGELDARLLFVLIELAELELEVGELGPARRHATRAVTIATRHYGAAHPVTAACGITLAAVALGDGTLDLAQPLLQAARLRVDASFDPLAPPRVSYLLARLALRTTPPDPERARRLTDEALAALRSHTSDEAARLRDTIEGLGHRTTLGLAP